MIPRLCQHGTPARRAIAAVAALALLAGCGKEAPPPAAKKTQKPEALVVRLGVAGPLTGPQAASGTRLRNGAQLAVDEVNAAGLEIGGRKVRLELLAADDQGGAETAITAARELVGGKVVAIVGHVNSHASIAASPVYAEAGLPQLSPSSNPRYTQQGFKTTFRLVANDDQLGAALAKYAVDTGARTIAVVDNGTTYGKGLADAFETAAKADGARLVARERAAGPDADFRALVLRLKTKKPDLVLFAGIETEGAALAQQMAALGLKTRLMGGDGIQTRDFIQLAGAAAEGVTASAPGLPHGQMPGGKSFQERYRQQFNADLGLNALLGYDAVFVIVGAMQRAGSTDPARFLTEIGKTQRNGLTSTIAFDEKGDLKNGPITLYAVKDGRWELAQTIMSEDPKPAAAADSGGK